MQFRSDASFVWRSRAPDCRTTIPLASEGPWHPCLCVSPEELKAWSRSLGHEDVLTTLTSYGAVPGYRQRTIMKSLRGRSNELRCNDNEKNFTRNSLSTADRK